MAPVLQTKKDFLKRVTRNGKCGCEGSWKMSWQEKEEFEAVVVVVVLGDEAKWWRTCVMAGNEKRLYLKYNKMKVVRFKIWLENSKI